MFSLVRKDVAAAGRLFWLVLAVGGAQLAALAFLPFSYMLGVLTFSAILAFGSLAIEEYQRTELLWISVPVTRAQIVTARYITTILGAVAGLTIGWTIANGARRLAPAAAEGPAALLSLEAHVVLLAVLILAAAVHLPLHFRLGAGRGLMSFIAISVLGMIVVSLATRLILSAKGLPSPTSDPAAWRELAASWIQWVEPRLTLLLALLAAFSAAMLLISLVISTRIYETRDI
jgi:ABC-type transport system involved in multi-copper enzyme maturation permease subunit